MDFAEIERVIRTAQPAPEKQALPLLKLAKFGDVRTAKKSLRHDDNVLEVYGLEGDYDGEQLPMSWADEALSAAGVAAVLYTSASHTPDKPRWRVVVALSAALEGTRDQLREQRRHWTGVLNAVLGGALTSESFALSQCYFFGRIQGRPDPEIIRLSGVCLDQMHEPPAPVFPSGSGKAKVESRTQSDDGIREDRSADLLARVGRDVRAGKADYEIHAAHAQHPHVLDQADPARAIQRAIDKARADCASERANGQEQQRAQTELETPMDQAGETRRPSQATRIVELCGDLDLWHADDEPYASMRLGDHRETWALRSRSMRALLARRYYTAERRAPGKQSVEDALAVLVGRAIHDGDARRVHTRVAEHTGTVYIDLCDEQWRAIEITAAGWRIVHEAPVCLIRRRGMQALPAPVGGGSLDLLRRYLTAREERDLRAIVAWLVQAYRPNGPYPVLMLGGEQGSGKSRTARILRALIDPSAALVRTMPRDERDLILAARNGWVVALDNLSGAAPWLSDALCRLSTGGGMSTRELYSDTDEIIIDVQRPVSCNGIDAIATRPDLADRATVVTLDPIPDEARKPEAEIWAQFRLDAPAIIGAICDAVSCALRRLPDVRLAQLPRMADHALWIEAASPALGWKPGEYVADYMRARDEIVGSAAEDSPVGVAIMRLVERKGEWKGTATELLAELAADMGAAVTHTRAWPASPRALVNVIARLAPALRTRGYRVERTRTHGGARTYVLGRQLGQSGDRPSPPSSPSPCKGDDGDARHAGDGTLHLCPSDVEVAV